jgi:hypothetical protein
MHVPAEVCCHIDEEGAERRNVREVRADSHRNASAHRPFMIPASAPARDEREKLKVVCSGRGQQRCKVMFWQRMGACSLEQCMYIFLILFGEAVFVGSQRRHGMHGSLNKRALHVKLFF